jgi:hypothetical protein
VQRCTEQDGEQGRDIENCPHFAGENRLSQSKAIKKHSTGISGNLVSWSAFFYCLYL